MTDTEFEVLTAAFLGTWLSKLYGEAFYAEYTDYYGASLTLKRAGYLRTDGATGVWVITAAGEAALKAEMSGE